MFARRALLRPLLLAVSAGIAALLAHIAIDLAGDVLLARDAYDELAHRSRDIVGLGVVGLTLLALTLVFRAARAGDAIGIPSGGRIRRGFVLVATALTPAVVAAMGALDAVLAARPIDDAGDLLGGSFVLGSLVALVTGALTALLVAHAPVALVRLARRLQATIRRLVHALAPASAHPRPLRAPRVRAARVAFDRRTRSKRGPPHTAPTAVLRAVTV